MADDEPYDPDAIDAFVEGLSAEDFGRLVARAIQERPHSQFWGLVNTAIEMEVGWTVEHRQVQDLIERIALSEVEPKDG